MPGNASAEAYRKALLKHGVAVEFPSSAHMEDLCASVMSKANQMTRVVVEHGRISQTGTHAQLMAEGGKYRTMVEQQIHMTLGGMTPATSTEASSPHL